MADVEVVLGVLAVEVAGHRDRRHVVKHRVQPARQLEDGAGALDVGGALLRLTGGEVVDGRTVHQMVYLTQLGDGLLGQPELGQPADQRLCPVAPLDGQAFEAAQRLAADQDPYLGIGSGGQQTGYDAAPNKPGTAGNDIPHAAIVAAGGRPRQPPVTDSIDVDRRRSTPISPD